ncbi:MAG: AAA family ATPase [Lachnospiraceae bacterium]|nr:AAA family ATPase [Lachnospiraceae bacterium]
MEVTKFIQFREKVVENCSKIILGKEKAIEKIAVSFLCNGHVLLEDVPGTGKTMLFRAFAKTLGGDFKRIQFTPDVMPSDVTGINFYNMKEGDFELRKGPVFTDVVLADEINRATPRTQSSLLEAMAEHQVSIDGTSYPLSQNFMVAATQNPLESHGTFPLPEAQLDRFFMKLSLGYMTRKEELAVMARENTTALLDKLDCVVTAEEIAELKKAYHDVTVTGPVADYIMDIIELTRNHGDITVGASTRGAIALYEASQVLAAFRGRDFVLPEDVKELAPAILTHRLTYRGIYGQGEAANVFEKLLDEVAVPTEEREK